MSVILSRDELKELTRRTHRATQSRVLAALGIPFKLHPETGALLVSPRAVDEALGAKGAPAEAANDSTEYQVDVEALRGHGKASAAR